MSLKKFYACELEDGKLVVVPKTWLFLENGKWKCRWSSSLEKAKGYSLVNPIWKAYRVEKFWAKKGTYAAAEQVLATLSGNSDVALSDIIFGTEPTEPESDKCTASSPSLPLKRHRKRKRPFDEIARMSEDSDDETSSKRMATYEHVAHVSESNDGDSSSDSTDDRKGDRVARSTPGISSAEGPLPVSSQLPKSPRYFGKARPAVASSPPSLLSPRISDDESDGETYVASNPPTISNSPTRVQALVEISTDGNMNSNVGDCLKKLCDITVATLKAVEEIRGSVEALQEDMAKVKVALVQYLPEEEGQDLFTMSLFDTPEEFEGFCDRLQEPNFKKLVIRYMVATYGQKSIGDTVRSILKASMTDQLMTRYNRTGARKMRKLPEIFELCILSTVKYFHRDSQEIKVKRGREEIRTTVKSETQKQLEIFLSNCTTRLQRKSGNKLSLEGEK